MIHQWVFLVIEILFIIFIIIIGILLIKLLINTNKKLENENKKD